MAAASPTQLQLAQLPTFNLLVLPLSTPSPAFQLQIKTTLNTLFGLTLSPDQLVRSRALSFPAVIADS